MFESFVLKYLLQRIVSSNVWKDIQIFCCRDNGMQSYKQIQNMVLFIYRIILYYISVLNYPNLVFTYASNETQQYLECMHAEKKYLLVTFLLTIAIYFIRKKKLWKIMVIVQWSEKFQIKINKNSCKWII